jgi:hypothetical protein
VVPSALVLATRRFVAVPLPLKLVTVSTLLPSALTTTTSVCQRSNEPEPFVSHCVVRDRPSRLMVVTVLSCSDPSPLRCVTLSVAAPLGATATSPCSVCSNTPSPVASCWMIVERPLALMVATERSLSEPSAL